MSLYELIAAKDMEDCTLAPYIKMVAEEQAKGHECVQPGQVEWLPKEDWPQNVVVSLDGSTVRIVAIYARNPGHGAFGRLITEIANAGLRPIVLFPGPQMLAICKAWGWQSEIEVAVCESWFEPTEGWLKHRGNPTESEDQS